MKSVALYLGSFNPVHNGHLAVAEYLLNLNVADEVWMVVSPQNPHKQQSELAPERDRLEMVRLAISGKSRIVSCDIEFRLPKPSYTINTIDTLKKEYPNTAFSILAGSDLAAGIERWREWQRLVAEIPFFVYPRNGNCSYRSEFTTLTDAPKMDISSTIIRDAVASGHNIEQYVPSVVAEYITSHGLYGKRY